MRSAVKFLPADAGSIGHVVDAASVPMGTFSSAARLKANLREWQRERNSVTGMVALQGGRDVSPHGSSEPDGNADNDWTVAWTELVERWLPNVVGFELLLANAVVARLVIADQLFKSGVRWPLRASPRIYVTNSLGDAKPRKPANVDSSLWRAIAASAATETRNPCSPR